MATLTYVYADSTAVLGPLATYAEPHGYDLCELHASRLTAPRGWQVIRLADNFAPPEPSSDDLEALANAVREAGRPRPEPADPAAAVEGAEQARADAQRRGRRLWAVPTPSGQKERPGYEVDDPVDG